MFMYMWNHLVQESVLINVGLRGRWWSSFTSFTPPTPLSLFIPGDTGRSELWLGPSGSSVNGLALALTRFPISLFFFFSLFNQLKTRNSRFCCWGQLKLTRQSENMKKRLRLFSVQSASSRLPIYSLLPHEPETHLNSLELSPRLRELCGTHLFSLFLGPMARFLSTGPKIVKINLPAWKTPS